MINRDAHIFTCVDSGETSDSELQEVIETDNDVHAGELETSTTLAMRPELVYMDRAQPHVPRFSSRYLDFGSNVSVSWFTRTSRISPSGVMGDPTKATPEKGRRAWEITIANMVELVEHLKQTSLEEIYRRRE
jgi:creatinine amidohydrolase/Fe(II)-dependent formamide hydrolase-like protein